MCSNCTNDLIQEARSIRDIGPFPGVVQIAASVGTHELLTDPANLAGAGPLTYHGGRVIQLGKGKVFNIYLGAQNFSRTDFDAFTKAVCENGYYLSPDGVDATPATFLGSAVFTPYPFGATVADSAVAAYLAGLVTAGKVPSSDAYTQYSIIFPTGTAVSLGGAASCSAFCGYHTRSSSGIYYQVIADSSCPGCHGSFTQEQARMMIQAHEIAEWRSDPDGNAWYNDQTGMENADECAWQMIPWGPAGSGWAVQPMAVNGKGCYTGVYTPSTPPPPPPPAGPTKTHQLDIYSDGSVKLV